MTPLPLGERRSPLAQASKRRFKIRGLDCAEEVAILKREIGPLVGGEERLSFDILKATMTIDGASAPERERTRSVFG